MASSVSSERAFSQGGITISKRRNRLKGDIVEALQCIKCAIHHDLLFREPGPSSSTEEVDESEVGLNGDDRPNEGDEDEEDGQWDALVLEDDSDIYSD
jgi:hypothetical protein